MNSKDLNGLLALIHRKKQEVVRRVEELTQAKEMLDDISEIEQHFLFELIERRHDNTSTIFCTQYRKDNWHSRLGGGIHADSIMDRIFITLFGLKQDQ